MKIVSDISLSDFEAWSGAISTLSELTHSECEQLESIFEDIYPDGMDSTLLNDILWFENDWVAEVLGYKNWEHLKRDHAGVTEEDNVRSIIQNEYPDVSTEYIDEYLDTDYYDEDMDEETIIDNFQLWLSEKEEEDED